MEDPSTTPRKGLSDPQMPRVAAKPRILKEKMYLRPVKHHRVLQRGCCFGQEAQNPYSLPSSL